MSKPAKGASLLRDHSCLLAVSKVSCAFMEGSRGHSHTAERFFTKGEWERAKRLARPFENLAARLAAKRALARLLALEGFWLPEYFFHRIEIVNRKTGFPVLRVNDRRLREIILGDGRRVLLSLTHSGLWGAAAVCFSR